MASRIRGNTTPDWDYSDPEDVGGLDVLLTFKDLEFDSSGIYWTAGWNLPDDCYSDAGCYWSGGMDLIPVVGVEII
jgi:hypothetical protein